MSAALRSIYLTMTSHICLTLTLGLGLALGWISTAAAQMQLPPTLPNPRLAFAFPAGAQRGQTLEIVIGGDDLDDARQLHFNCAGITAIPKLVEPGLGQSGPQPVPGTFTVTIRPDVRPGVYELRAEGRYGLSTPRAFVVGTAPELREIEPNDSLKQATSVPLGSVVNGNADVPALDYFKFTANAGQRVIIDCQAFRIDSRLDGTLVLFNAAGKELDRSRNANRRDPMIDFQVPADGEYVVALHDHVYGYYTMPGEMFYRLSISTAPHLDFIFPPAGLPGSMGTYTLFGRNLPGGLPAPGIEVGGRQLEQLTVTIPLPAERAQDLVRDGGLLVEPSESFLDGVTFRLDSPQGMSNPLLLSVATAPIVVEQEPNDDPARAPLLNVPCEYVGQFYPRGDRDWVSFQATKGQTFWIDVISQRLGLSTDPRLLIQQVKRDDLGKEQIVDLQSVDDDLANADRVHWSFLDSLLFPTASHDPSHRFVAPDDGVYRIMVLDTSRPSQDLLRSPRGSHRQVYRLAIRTPQPDFRLVAVPRPPTNSPFEASSHATVWSPVVRRGGAELIEVFVHRRDGFDEPIEVTIENLPPGVTASPILIAPKQSSGTLVLKGAEDAPAGIGWCSVFGKAKRGSVDIVRQARPATMVWAVQLTGVTHHRSRLADQLPVTVLADEQAPFDLQIEPGLQLEAPHQGSVEFPVRVTRRGNFQGKLELFVYGLPPTIYGPLHAQPKYHTPIELKAEQTSIDFKIVVPNHVPAGNQSFFVSGVGTVSYARNPKKRQAAEDRLMSIDKIVATDELDLKQAQQLQADAVKALAEAQTSGQNVQVAAEAKAAADKRVAEVDARSKKNVATRTAVQQEVMTLREKTKPTDLKISAPSNTARLNITPVPVPKR